MPRSTSADLQEQEQLVIRGCRVHNLRNISVSIPRNSLTVLTGPSGSGKSSLAFDTIYAEGQRRYVESLSVYARQFLDQLSKPDCDSIDGLSPTIAIEQKTTSHNPRSTVGTVTEISDFLRVLYARLARPFCYQCGRPIESQSRAQILDRILELPENSKVILMAPIVRGRKGEYQKELASLRARGFVRVRVDGVIRELEEEIELDRQKKHDIEVVVDRFVIPPKSVSLGSGSALPPRISESLDLALKLSGGSVLANDILFSEDFACTHCGISYPAPEPRLFSFNSPMGWCPECEGLGCTDCEGSRLRKESLSFKLQGKSIAQVSQLQLPDALAHFRELTLTEREKKIGSRLLTELENRLSFLISVGVPYLTLSRTAETLSGGESQRIRLATQLGSELVDVVYVLDEPSIGLHPRDHGRLMNSLERLRDLGNTVLVVEHDRDTMERADYIVDLGPGAGIHGGEVIATGTFNELVANPKGITSQYLAGKISVPTPLERRKPEHHLKISGVTLNNLRDVSVDIPLGVFVGVSGVSGSGKSSLVIDTLVPSLKKKLGLETEVEPPPGAKIDGLEHLDKVIEIDQAPIGRTPRSNPATYTGLFSLIRDLFSSLPESQIRGFKPGRFSFNVPGGRCEECEGDGQKRVVMHFLPDVFVECDACHGGRYSPDTLEVKFKGKNIAEVLAMQASEALELFSTIPQVHQKLKILCEVGLGYIGLGQSATTLSGGEAQRIKLAKELARRDTGRTLYVLDEPSTGLHFDDLRKLLEILQRLVTAGNTVVVIEHNLDVLKTVDYLVDLGPEGGSGGGKIIATGTPEQVAQNPRSHTGNVLKSVFHP